MKQKDLFSHCYFGDIYSKIILVICTVVALILRHYIFAALMACGSLCAFLFSGFSFKSGMQKTKKQMENDSFHVGASESMPGFPFPAASITEKGKIAWYNSALDKLLEGELLFQKDIHEFIKDFDIDAADETGKYPVYRAFLKGAPFYAHAHRIPKQAEGGELTLLYFLDAGKQEQLQEAYTKNRFVVMTVAFDNFEEVMQGMEDEDRNAIQAAVDRCLTSMTVEIGGVIRKTERDRYSIFLSAAALEVLINKKFPILDAIRELQSGNTIAPTLSIGIGMSGETFLENDNFARTALDMALGRGGDQVVLKDQNTLQYFGGRTREVEKRTKVKARVIAFALRELIMQCDNILVIGHKNADADCVGAAMGIHAIARLFRKKAYILQYECDDAAAAVMKRAEEETEYKGVFVKRNGISDILMPKSLIVVVDTNSFSHMEPLDIFGVSEHIVLVDHHRRSVDFVKNPTLAYHEPYASSTCEMITEMLPYLDTKNILLKVEAEALYAGMYLDTKCFTYKTGVRTLEAAAYLRRAGIDPIIIKQFFKSNLETFTMKASLIQGAKIVKKHIAISVSDEERSSSLVAQAADELLNIVDIDTAFVIATRDGCSLISGRSTGSINVQVVLEKLGGGGHFSVAGAQLKGVSPAEAETLLMQALEDYLSEQ